MTSRQTWLGDAVAALTVVTFGLAITALPNSGRGCTTDCVGYPFTGEDVAAQFPGDYLWMIPAMLLMPLVVALVGAAHLGTPPEHRLASLTALCLTCMAAAILLTDYFVQLTVMPISLEKEQLDGWSLLTQYNPNGVFLALEELGYLLLAAAFGVLGRALAGSTRQVRILRGLLTASTGSCLAALVAVSVVHGWDRQDSFEIPAISIIWLTLVIAGPMLARHLRRAAPA